MLADGIAMLPRLAECGIPSPSGKRHWSFPAVRDILRRTVYTGTVSAYAQRYDRRPSGGYVRRAGTDDEIVVLPTVAPAVVTPEEQAAILARLATNEAEAARNNRAPDAPLLRAGFLRCGHRGQTLRVVHWPSNLPGSSPQYRCAPSDQRAPDCPHPTIAASMIDPVVWEKAASSILSAPRIIADEVAIRRQDGELDRDHVALTKFIASITDKQARIAKRLADIDDDDVAAPLIAELQTLSARKRAIQAEQAALQQRIADRDAETSRVATLADWCQTVAANLDTLTYEERRLALTALGVQVRICTRGSTDAEGSPYPRWEITMRPALAGERVVNGSTRRTSSPPRSGHRTRGTE